MYKKISKLSLTLAIYIAISFLSINAYSQSDLDEAYYQLNEGNYDGAAAIFENYIAENPNATNIYLQLAYIYKTQKKIDKSIEYFNYVKNYSYNSDEIANAEKELEYLESSKSYEKLDQAYSLLNRGDEDGAITLFKDYVDEKPNDSKILLQLGYLYANKKDYDSAIVYFEKVKNRSTIIEDVNIAKKQLDNINNMRNSTGSANPTLDSAYALLNSGRKSDAIKLLEEYSTENPSDTKVQLQLAYLYNEKKNYTKAKRYFENVSKYSTSSDERNKANLSLGYLNDYRMSLSPSSVDIYFYNYYDVDQENYISNFVGKYQYRLFKNFNTGIYGDVYMDSKSNKNLIYNDRYVEAGGFFRYNFFPSLAFEFRAGYVRLIDKDENKFNFKPILTFSDRFGNSPIYRDSKVKSQNFYFDTYAAALYDHKYENFFGQAQLREVLRYMIRGYSFFEVYLKQNIQGDSKQLDYNNYGELGGGIAYTPNIKNFPLFFIEALNRFYTVSNDNGVFPASSFQFRIGFQLTYNSPL